MAKSDITEAMQSALVGLGLNAKEATVYLSLLSLGPTAIRKIAEHTGINRGTTHDALKELQHKGLVSYYHKEKRQHFVAEEPKALANLLLRKKQEIEDTERAVHELIPRLSSLSRAAGSHPTVKYYRGGSGIRTILEDVLDSAERLPKKEYAAYSSSSIRPYLYHKDAFPKFTDERIKRKIAMRAIGIGPGGDIHGKDERKWLTKEESAPTYTILYAGKVAMISVSESGVPHGLIIEDEGIYTTQLLLFDSLWNLLR
ncbi:MAG: helix-turn-helix domain-containing protein [Candidatus Liptonbacteria bacterium]|nr:helix-turn-helix domain-containing protein [Candidatus Liptonbacteria bacterium]